MPSRAIPLITATMMTALLSLPHAACAGSEVYIQQSHGRVARGSSTETKPLPELTTQPSQQPAAAPTTSTAPDTCNAQNAASSQACYTATQQARPASR